MEMAGRGCRCPVHSHGSSGHTSLGASVRIRSHLSVPGQRQVPDLQTLAREVGSQSGKCETRLQQTLSRVV